ncbi:MAG: hypothetical protein F6K17_01165 [Okeania sp. SIO3C4]|nr:hypothetical protein [Okeania sp. SIO3C4]
MPPPKKRTKRLPPNPKGNPDIVKHSFKAKNPDKPNIKQLPIRVDPDTWEAVKAIDNWADHVRDKIYELIEEQEVFQLVIQVDEETLAKVKKIPNWHEKLRTNVVEWVKSEVGMGQ